MPIRLRLAVWYGCLAGILLALLSVATYATHTRAHYDDLDRALSVAASHVANEYRQTSSGSAAVLRDPIAPDLIIQAYDESGRLVIPVGSSNLPFAADPRRIVADPAGPAFDVVARLAPGLVDLGNPHGAFGLMRDDGGRRWRLYVLHLEGAGYLMAAAPLNHIDASVNRFRWLVTLISAWGVVVMIVAGFFLARRALRPVAAVTQTAAGIAHSRSFGLRVPVENERDELGQLARTFNEMLASLQQAYEAQQRFVADASHELRAPLTIIQANLDFVEHRGELTDPEQRAAIGEASLEARRLATLVAELLALARADTGAEIRKESVELDRILLEAVGDMQRVSRGQRVEVTAIEPVMVLGDGDRLRQLFIALLDNAIKYTPPEGRVVVSLRRDGRDAEVRVADTGIGIATEDLSHVVERFYRADRARSRDPGGTGLGLPIARWVARQHGGDVTLQSEAGRGSTAIIRIPGLD